MQAALDLARRGIEQRDGGPFGAVVVIDNKIVGRGWNQVVVRHDPTAHAEILAIRDACQRLSRFHLEDATLYSSCEPCPMCLAAVHWARIDEAGIRSGCGCCCGHRLQRQKNQPGAANTPRAERPQGAPADAERGTGAVSAMANGSAEDPLLIQPEL